MEFRDLFTLIEIGLLLIGVALLWIYGLSPKAQRAATAARLRADGALHWNISSADFLLFIFCVITGGLVTQLTCTPLLSQLAPDSEDLAAATLVLGGAFHSGMLAGVAFFRLALRREDRAEDEHATATDETAPYAQPTPTPPPRPRSPFTPRALRNGLATLLMALPLIAATGLLWQAILRLFGVEIEEQEIVGVFAETESPLMLLGMGFLAIVLAPVTEELIFRAGLFRYLRDRAPRWISLALPALLFAAMHGNLASFAPLAALGLVFSIAYERSGTIAVPIVAHALFNLNTLLMILGGLSGGGNL